LKKRRNLHLNQNQKRRKKKRKKKRRKRKKRKRKRKKKRNKLNFLKFLTKTYQEININDRRPDSIMTFLSLETLHIQKGRENIINFFL